MRATTKNFVLLTAVSATSLILVELFVRFFFPQQLIILRPDIWKPARIFGHRHQNNANTLVNLGEKTVHFVTDSNGYRINQMPSEVDMNPDLSLLMIGDSFLEGLQVENEFTIPQIIRRQLERQYHKPIGAENAGVSGWHPNQYFLEAKHILLKKSYDLGIVFLFVQNDVQGIRVTSYPPQTHSPRHQFRLPQSVAKGEIIDAIFYPINDFLEERSHFFVFFKTVARVQLAKIGLTALYFPSIFNVQEKESSQWSMTALICNDIKQEFEKYHTPVFFVLLPPIYQVYDSVYKEYQESFSIDPDTIDLLQPNKLLKAEFNKKGLTLLDPLAHMKEKANNNVQMYGLVDRHFNEKGHQIVAEYILPTVEAHLTSHLH